MPTSKSQDCVWLRVVFLSGPGFLRVLDRAETDEKDVREAFIRESGIDATSSEA